MVDVNKKTPEQDITNILQISDIVVVTLMQSIKTLNDFVELRTKNDFFKRKNVMLAIGRYDKFSKYSNKNITRYLKEKKELLVIPYNTLFFESCSEGDIIDFFLKTRNITDLTDRNVSFVERIKIVDENIVEKMQEIQMKI